MVICSFTKGEIYNYKWDTTASSNRAHDHPPQNNRMGPDSFEADGETLKANLCFFFSRQKFESFRLKAEAGSWPSICDLSVGWNKTKPSFLVSNVFGFETGTPEHRKCRSTFESRNFFSLPQLLRFCFPLTEEKFNFTLFSLFFGWIRVEQQNDKRWGRKIFLLFKIKRRRWRLSCK